MRRLLELSQTQPPFPDHFVWSGINPIAHLFGFQSLIPSIGGNEGGTAMLNAARDAGRCAVAAIALCNSKDNESIAKLFTDTLDCGQSAYIAAQMEADIVTYELFLNQGCPVLYSQDAGFAQQVWRDQVLWTEPGSARTIKTYGPLWNIPRPAWWPQESIRGAFLPNQPLCMLSYSSRGKEEELAERIYHHLRRQGVQCWKWNKEPRLGKRMIDSFRECLELGGVVLLIASKESLARAPVIEELELARSAEIALERRAEKASIGIANGWAPIMHAARIDDDILSWLHPLGDRFKPAFIEDLRDWELSEPVFQKAMDSISLNLRQSWGELRSLRFQCESSQRGYGAPDVARPGVLRRLLIRMGLQLGKDGRRVIHR